jgi:hypothetical protein
MANVARFANDPVGLFVSLELGPEHRPGDEVVVNEDYDRGVVTTCTCGRVPRGPDSESDSDDDDDYRALCEEDCRPFQVACCYVCKATVVLQLEVDAEYPSQATGVVSSDRTGVILPAQRVVGFIEDDDTGSCASDLYDLVLTPEVQAIVTACDTYDIAHAFPDMATDCRNYAVLESGVLQTWKGD